MHYSKQALWSFEKQLRTFNKRRSILQRDGKMASKAEHLKGNHRESKEA